MNESQFQSLFFVSLPDLRKLCGVNVVLSSDTKNTDVRSQQIKLCRNLLRMCPDVLVSPVLGTCDQVLVVMAVPFFKTGYVQSYVESWSGKVGFPQRVVPAMLQACLSYTLASKLAPVWNKAGYLLIQGKTFLEQTGRQNAIAMEFNVSETQLCISLEAYTVRLPPAQMRDFDISVGAVKNFNTNKTTVIQRHSILSNWCYVLPSMKKGQIINISHTIPPECPLKSYTDFQKHWMSLYGYRLPQIKEDEAMYCSVYFKLIGERLFTYPFCCIRSQPLQFFPRVNLEGTLSSFLCELKLKMPHLCGFPVKMTSKPCYSTKELVTPSSEGSQTRPTNLTTKAPSRPVLIQVPEQQVSLASIDGFCQKVEPLNKQRNTACSSDWSSGCTDTKEACSRSTMQSTDWAPQSTQQNHSSQGVRLATHLVGPQRMQAKAALCTLKGNTSKIIPIFKSKLLQQDKSLRRVIDERRKQNLFQPPSKPGVDAKGFRVVRDFKPGHSQMCKAESSTTRSQPLNSLSQRQTEHPKWPQTSSSLFQKAKSSAGVSNKLASSNGKASAKDAGGDKLATCMSQLGNKGALSASVSKVLKRSSVAVGRKKHGAPDPHPVGRDRPVSKAHWAVTSTDQKAGKLRTPHFQNALLKAATSSSGISNVCAGNTEKGATAFHPENMSLFDTDTFMFQKSGGAALESAAKPSVFSILGLRPSGDGQQEEGYEPKPKKPKVKPVVQDVDIEEHAKNSQLARLNTATLQSWLKQHGVSVKARDKKEELVTKIIQFISEP
nr:PREDICTED: uncharacterized protein C18orf63 homolog isoform X2 [Latimeria chalumnae]|eukprot:XP_014340890.1 PREDICTED: uncharacterized protein C18orf63 homolog isoform X2 [Latimeria chalumnae]